MFVRTMYNNATLTTGHKGAIRNYVIKTLEFQVLYMYFCDFTFVEKDDKININIVHYIL